MESNIQDLPTEVLAHVFDFIPSPPLYLASVCKAFKLAYGQTKECTTLDLIPGLQVDEGPPAGPQLSVALTSRLRSELAADCLRVVRLPSNLSNPITRRVMERIGSCPRLAHVAFRDRGVALGREETTAFNCLYNLSTIEVHEPFQAVMETIQRCSALQTLVLTHIYLPDVESMYEPLRNLPSTVTTLLVSFGNKDLGYEDTVIDSSFIQNFSECLKSIISRMADHKFDISIVLKHKGLTKAVKVIRRWLEKDCTAMFGTVWVQDWRRPMQTFRFREPGPKRLTKVSIPSSGNVGELLWKYQHSPAGADADIPSFTKLISISPIQASRLCRRRDSPVWLHIWQKFTSLEILDISGWCWSYAHSTKAVMRVVRDITSSCPTLHTVKLSYLAVIYVSNHDDSTSLEALLSAMRGIKTIHLNLFERFFECAIQDEEAFVGQLPKFLLLARRCIPQLRRVWMGGDINNDHFYAHIVWNRGAEMRYRCGYREFNSAFVQKLNESIDAVDQIESYGIDAASIRSQLDLWKLHLAGVDTSYL